MMHVTFAAFALGGLICGFFGYKFGRWTRRSTQ
jgi:hypothetical protein